MNSAEFSSDVVRRERLMVLLSDPVFTLALSIVEESMEPQTGTQADAVPAIAAAKMHQIAGANELKKRLFGLSKEPREVKSLKGRQILTQADLIP